MIGYRSLSTRRSPFPSTSLMLAPFVTVFALAVTFFLTFAQPRMALKSVWLDVWNCHCGPVVRVEIHARGFTVIPRDEPVPIELPLRSHRPDFIALSAALRQLNRYEGQTLQLVVADGQSLNTVMRTIEVAESLGFQPGLRFLEYPLIFLLCCC